MHLYNTELAVLQFTVRSTKFVPPILKQFEDRPEDELSSAMRRERNQNGSGQLLTQTKEPCDLSFLVARLERAHFQLAGASWEARTDERFSDKRYVNLRFVFARHPREDGSKAFRAAKKEIRRALIDLLNGNFWGVRIFDNPLYMDGREIEGRRCLLLNIGHRKDRTQKERPRDKNGRQYGAPEPIVPRYTVWFPDGRVRMDLPRDVEAMKKAYYGDRPKKKRRTSVS